MRIPALVRIFLLLLAIAFPALLRAQFQQPSDFTFAKPEEYQDLRGFYQKIAAADQQQLVLTRTPVAKGN